MPRKGLSKSLRWFSSAPSPKLMPSNRFSSLKALAFASSGLCLAHPAFSAIVTLTATNGIGTSSFESSLSWSNGEAPSAANDYVVASGRNLRTVADSGSATFAGNSLALGDGGTAGALIFKNQEAGAVVTVNNLTMNNGEVQAGATSAGVAHAVTLSSNGITLVGSNRINTGGAGRSITLDAPISGTGKLVVSNNGLAVFSGAGAYTGGTDIGANGGATVVRATASGALGTGDIFIAGNGGSNRIELEGGISLPNNINHNGKNNTVGQPAGVLNRSGNNTISGTITVQTGGTDSTIQSDAGVLTLAGATALTTNAGTGRRVLLTGAGDISVTGAITNGASSVEIVKQGAGTLTLSGTNTYTGATTVSNGLLLVNGSLANTALTVASGATLGGSGTIGGAATVNGILAPGNSAGVLTFASNLTLGSGSTSIFEIGGATRGAEYDGVNVDGALVYAGTLNLLFNAPLTGGNYSLFSGQGSRSGAFSSVTFGGSFAEAMDGAAAISGNGWTASSASWFYSFDNATGSLAISVIPEPSVYAMLAGLAGLVAAVVLRRRRD
jgi:MYXO-CTERM domain-containing protein